MQGNSMQGNSASDPAPAERQATDHLGAERQMAGRSPTPSGPAPDSRAAAQAATFAARLSKLARHLRRLPTKQGITCFRIYERDIPEVPLVVDRYEDHLHLTEYDRPTEREPVAHDAWRDLMARTAGEKHRVSNALEDNFVRCHRARLARGVGQTEEHSRLGHRLSVGRGHCTRRLEADIITIHH